MWERTALWRRLVAATSPEDPLRAEVARAMPAIETLLAQGGTAPRQFTLHDAEHSRRVAERMSQIVPAATWELLSPNELALLLLGAYLHDIGMTPAYGRVAAYHALLVDGHDGVLDAGEREAFQGWLDRTRPGVEIATGPRAVSTAELRRIDELVAHWVREQHVTWSEDWIRAQLHFEVPGHPAFDEDLIVLCRSHHDGLDVLRTDRFDPRFVDGATVHLRYLAAVLRVADVLEVDPGRTPPIVFRHRAVDGESAAHWHKDQELTIAVEDGERVSAEASPTSATLHRAIEETVDQIERELRLVQSLAGECPFESAPPRRQRLPHTWRIEPLVYRRVRPKDDAYVYVEGGFRPNTDKLLELLGGSALYGSPLHAVRELLQNAFDAVRERIGWQRLAHADAPALLAALEERHEVALELTADVHGALWLVCSDTGAGMTKEIVTERVLVSGSGPSAELLQLRRDLRARGLPFERTGRFGVGVLSYFMLGERVVIETRRCPEARSREGTGWSFSTEGVGSFGELRRLEREEPGTRVAIRLDALGGSLRDVWETIATYVKQAVVRVPCMLRLAVPALGIERRVPAGWVDDREALVVALLQEWRPGGSALARPRVRRQLRWLELDQELPHGLGRFHALLPYYTTPRGLVLMPLDLEARGTLRRGVIVHAQDAAPSWTESSDSWHGMRIDPDGHQEAREPSFVTIDWRSDAAGELSVARTSLDYTAAAKRARAIVEGRVGEALARLVAQHRDSAFTPANVRVLPEQTPFADDYDDTAWVVYDPADAGRPRPRRRWKRLDGPLLQRIDHDMWSRPVKVLIGGKPVTCLAPLTSRRSLEWGDRHWPPDRLVIDRRLQRLALLWNGPRRSARTFDGFDPALELPPQLAHVASVIDAGRHAFNAGHPLVRAVNAREGVWRAQRAQRDVAQLDRTAMLSSPATAAAWLLWFVHAVRDGEIDFFGPGFDDDDLWSRLCADEPELVAQAWGLAWSEHDGEPAPLVTLDLDGIEPNLFVAHTFSPEGMLWEDVVPYRLVSEQCAGASDEWLVTEQP